MGTNSKASETTNSYACTLSWKKYKLTIPLGSSDNVATFSLAPGYEKFHAFCAEADITNDEDDSITCEEANVMSDDEDKPSGQDDEVDNDSASDSEGDEEHETKSHPCQTEFNLDGPQCHAIPTHQDDEEDRQSSTNAMLVLKCHQKFGHVSMKRLQEMAKHDIVPRKLANCPLPVCSACLHAKATKKQWRSEPTKSAAALSF